MSRIVNSILAGLAVVGSIPAVSAVPSIILQVGTSKLTMQLPQGYCVPRGYVAGVADAIARADEQNFTLATFIGCEHQDDEDAMKDYVIIKASKRAAMMNFDKASTLDQLNIVASSPKAPKADERMLKKTSDSIESATGQRLEFEGAIEYAGRDSDCIYLAGRMGLKDKPEGSLLVVGCTTVAGGKLITVYRYDARPIADVATLKAETRNIAISINKPVVRKAKAKRRT